MVRRNNIGIWDILLKSQESDVPEDPTTQTSFDGRAVEISRESEKDDWSDEKVENFQDSLWTLDKRSRRKKNVTVWQKFNGKIKWKRESNNEHEKKKQIRETFVPGSWSWIPRGKSQRENTFEDYLNRMNR